ncbi:hypothetical protein WJX77_012423 [Trebouxia sp. C0004]
MMDDPRPVASTIKTSWGIALIAFLARLTSFAISQIANNSAADYDTSAGLQRLDCCSADTVSVPLADSWSQSKAVWDSVFFTRIALCGYEYEQFYAFFPLLPGLMNVGMKSVQGIKQGLLPDAALASAATCLSLAAFVTSAVYLHKLSISILKDARLADLAALLYIWNPASVFYSVAYTEGLFACTAFVGLFHLNQRPWLATAFFCAASAARSNGILHCWFILHRLANMLYHQHDGQPLQGADCAMLLSQAALQCMLICLPAFAFQYAGWRSFCVGGITKRPWCSTKPPSIYSFVQSHYWGVGLFRYFHLQQLPNFLLALPVLCLSFAGCWTYFSQDWKRALLLGIHRAAPRQVQTAVQRWPAKPTANKQHGFARAENGFGNDRVAPYVYQWALMTACTCFVMHVQVATRFLSACPPLYWYIASLHNRKWIWAYFLLYFCLGSILFPNFYPWT